MSDKIEEEKTEEKEESTDLFFDEDELGTSNTISLYKELLRIIERDIDKEESINSRKGLSVWGIVVAIAGSIMFILGETRKIQIDTPFQYEEIGIIFLIALFFLHLFYAILATFGGNYQLVKPGRIASFKDSLFQMRGNLLIRAVVLILTLFIISFASFSLIVKIVSFTIISIFILYCVLYFYLSFTDKNLGNRPEYSKVAPTALILYIVLNLVLVVTFILGANINLPIGEAATYPYIIGFLSAGVIFLIELLVLTFASSNLISKLSELRDDIIFQRVYDINDALIKYQIIKEGKTLFYEISADYEKLNFHIQMHEDNLSNQKILIDKIEELLTPKNGSSKLDKEKLRNEIKPFFASLNILAEKVINTMPTLQSEVTSFNNRLFQSANISGDYKSLELIKDSMEHRFRYLDSQLDNIERKKELVRLFLINPDSEIPALSVPKDVKRIKKDN